VGYTVIVRGAETGLLPLAFVATKVTVYVPGVLKTITGFWLPLVPDGKTFGGAPPKFQFHDVGVFVERSLKFTTSGGQPAVAPVVVKLATGACPFTRNAANRPIVRRKGSFLING
jgi:hypothetical protein